MGKLKFTFALNENFLGRYVLWRYFISKLNAAISWISRWTDSNDRSRRLRTHTVWIVSGAVTRSFHRFLSRKFPVYRRLLLFLITRKINLALISSDGRERKVSRFWKMSLTAKLRDLLCWLIFVYYVPSAILTYTNPTPQIDSNASLRTQLAFDFQHCF